MERAGEEQSAEHAVHQRFIEIDARKDTQRRALERDQAGAVDRDEHEQYAMSDSAMRPTAGR